MWELILEYKIFFFIALGLLIPLLGYAVFLQWGQLNTLKKEKEDRKKAYIQQYNDRQSSLKESLRIISMAAIQGQCEISEASLRMAKLLPLFDQIDHDHSDYQALFELYNDIKNLKYLEERNALNINQRFAEDKMRYAAEDKHKEEMLKVCERIYEHTKN
jgi:hypothetical protein